MDVCVPVVPVVSRVPEVIVLPELFGIAVGDIAVLIIKLNSLGEYEMTGGTAEAYIIYSRLTLEESR